MKEQDIALVLDAHDHIKYLQEQLAHERLRNDEYAHRLEECGIYILPTSNSIYHSHQRCSNDQHTTCITIPTSPNDIRKLLEGSSSLLNYIKIPEIHIQDGFSIVYPSDVLELYVNLGLSFQSISGNDSYHQHEVHSPSRQTQSRNVIEAAGKYHPDVPFVPLVYTGPI